MTFISISDVEARLPRPLDLTERDRAQALISDAAGDLRYEFERVGRDLDQEFSARPGFAHAVKRVLVEMVSGALLVGASAGVKHVSSTTGPQSDSVTYATPSHGWGGVWLTDEQKERLGLVAAALPGYIFPPASRWPERVVKIAGDG